MADAVQKYLDKYKELEALAYSSIFESKRSFSQADVQDRIRTMAIIKELVDAEDTANDR